jgi:hypothetical protein
MEAASSYKTRLHNITCRKTLNTHSSMLDLSFSQECVCVCLVACNGVQVSVSKLTFQSHKVIPGKKP